MNRLFSVFLPAILGGIFIYAGAVKVMEPAGFYHDIVLYHLLDDDFSWLLAHYLPWLEITAGLGVICRFSRPAAAFILAMLLVIFMGAVVSAWLRGLNLVCGCFGHSPDGGSYSWILIRDVVLLTTALYFARSAAFQNRIR